MGDPLNISIREHEECKLPKEFPFRQFNAYLDEVWMNRLCFAEEELFEQEDKSKISTEQQFFHFKSDSLIKARNYIGFIQWQNCSFDVIPKVFENKNMDYPSVWDHLFYWLKYCRKIRFPFTHIESPPENIENLPEALIYAFAKYTNNLLKESPFSQYEEIKESSPILRGRLNISGYISEQFSKGNPQILVMDHEPFIHDNLLNRIIKYVAGSLLHLCRFKETYHELQSIVFQLEDVSDVMVSYSDCNRVRINRLFQDYSMILDMCKFFLLESYLIREKGNLQNLSFMLPMEYVFEDFLAGFIECNFSESFSCTYQSKNWLTDQEVFRIRNDLVVRNRITGEKLIIDAKYKMRQIDETGKQGINQDDLYQMISYGLRGNCDKILLLYPFHKRSSEAVDCFTISSEMMPGRTITVFAADVPIIFNNLKTSDQCLKERLVDIFEKIQFQY